MRWLGFCVLGSSEEVTFWDINVHLEIFLKGVIVIGHLDVSA